MGDISLELDRSKSNTIPINILERKFYIYIPIVQLNFDTFSLELFKNFVSSQTVKLVIFGKCQ